MEEWNVGVMTWVRWQMEQHLQRKKTSNEKNICKRKHTMLGCWTRVGMRVRESIRISWTTPIMSCVGGYTYPPSAASHPLDTLGGVVCH